MRIPIDKSSSTGFGGDNPEDCFRHIFFSAVYTQKLGILAVKALGDLSEFIQWIRCKPSSRMDIFNHNIGCALGWQATKENLTRDQIAQKVYDLMYGEGALGMLDLGDDRQTRFTDFFKLIFQTIKTGSPAHTKL